jgi:hypothetical protein
MVKYTNKMSVPAEDPINVGEEFAPKITDPEEHAAPAPDIESESMVDFISSTLKRKHKKL